MQHDAAGCVGNVQGQKVSEYMDRESQIRKVLAELVDDPSSIGPEESLLESGLLDSFSLTSLMGALEREFHFKIPDSDLIPQRFDSISKIQQYVAIRLKEQA